MTSRSIPFIRPITEAALTIINAPKSAPSIVKQAFATLSALVETVPTFIGSNQLLAILHAGIVHRMKDEIVSLAVISKASKKIPTQTMFPVIMDLWKVVQSEGESVSPALFGIKSLMAPSR